MKLMNELLFQSVFFEFTLRETNKKASNRSQLSHYSDIENRVRLYKNLYMESGSVLKLNIWLIMS